MQSKLASSALVVVALVWGCGGGASTPAPAATSSGAEQAAPAAESSSDGEGSAEAPSTSGFADPTKVSPEVFKVIADNPHVRVLEATWQPGQVDKMHGHPALVAYALTEIFGLSNDPDESQVSIRIKKDQALLQAPVSAHAFENRGKNVAKMLIFERKGGEVEHAPRGAAKEAQSASPEIYELVAFDTTIHVLRATWKPGQTDDFHSHPGYTAYALTDIDGKVVDANDKETPFSMKAGTVKYFPPEKEHRFENTGSAVAQMLLIEEK